jgi:hypothetical protein
MPWEGAQIFVIWAFIPLKPKCRAINHKYLITADFVSIDKDIAIQKKP